MNLNKDYNDAQLEAIEDYYQTISDYDQEELTLEEAIINWFVDGHAEKFREDFLSENEVTDSERATEGAH